MPKLKQQSGLLRGLCLYRALQPEPCDALFCSPNPRTVLYTHSAVLLSSI